MTDVTGFGVLGHGLEMARASNLRITVRIAELPLLHQAKALAERGFITGASNRNWDSYGAEVQLPPDLPAGTRALLTDPQTSGGLLVACEAAEAERLVAQITSAGFHAARVIGHAEAGMAKIVVV